MSRSLTIFAKSCIVDVWLCSKCTFVVYSCLRTGCRIIPKTHLEPSQTSVSHKKPLKAVTIFTKKASCKFWQDPKYICVEFRSRPSEPRIWTKFCLKIRLWPRVMTMSDVNISVQRSFGIWYIGESVERKFLGEIVFATLTSECLIYQLLDTRYYPDTWCATDQKMLDFRIDDFKSRLLFLHLFRGISFNLLMKIIQPLLDYVFLFGSVIF